MQNAKSLEGRVHFGKAEKFLPELEPESVDLYIADPPYNVSRKNNLETMGRRGIEFKWDGDFDQETWIRLAAPSVRPGGHMVIWNDWKNLGLMASVLEECGFEAKRPIVWRKTNPAPRNRDRVFVQAQEFAVWATKLVRGKHKWTFNRRADRGYERGEFDIALPEEGDALEIDAAIQRAFHPAKKPDRLIEELVGILSNEGDLVVDPFAGEGTVSIACEKMNRRHIAFELDSKNHAYAEKALLAAVAGSAAKFGRAIDVLVESAIDLSSFETPCGECGKPSGYRAPGRRPRCRECQEK